MRLEKDMLISRVVDGVAGATDWSELERLAASDSGVWREIALAQRDQRLLGEAMAPAFVAADMCALPDPDAIAYKFSPSGEASPRHRWARALSWGGWAAAAAIGLAFAQHSKQQSPASSDPMQAGIGSFLNPISSLKDRLSADEALELYRVRGRQEGRYVMEMPNRVLVESSQRPDGQWDVIYIRQLVEKGVVKDLYRVSHDELGNPTPVPVAPSENPAPRLAPTDTDGQAPTKPIVLLPTDRDALRIDHVSGA